MNYIYRKAFQVLVWLSAEQNNLDLTVTNIKEIAG